MNETTHGLLALRFPEVLAWLEAAPREPWQERDAGAPRPALVVRGLQAWSAFDPCGEARAQAALVPPRAPRATCYGVGSGELPRALLARPALRELRVVLFDPGVARTLIACAVDGSWVADPRVELARARDLLEVETPFAASPIELRLAEDAAAPLADRVALELAAPRLATAAAELEPVLRARLEAARPRLERGGDAAALFGRWRKRTVVVAAAGPTLAPALPRLARRTEPLVAVDAALRPLLDAGAPPDAVVTIDPHRGRQLPCFAGDLSACVRIPLVHAPDVHPDVLARWPGPRLAFYLDRPRYAELARDLPRAVLWSAGSALHPAVDLAVRAGAARVVLVGADFVPSGGVERGATRPREGEGARAPARLCASLISARGERLPTVPRLVGHLRELERYVARRPDVSFVCASRAGARIAGVEHEGDLAAALARMREEAA